MKAKLCKRLRKTAREVSVGMPERRIIAVERPNRFNLKINVVSINDSKTTRGIYRQLKKTFSRKSMMVQK